MKLIHYDFTLNAIIYSSRTQGKINQKSIPKFMSYPNERPPLMCLIHSNKLKTNLLMGADIESDKKYFYGLCSQCYKHRSLLLEKIQDTLFEKEKRERKFSQKSMHVCSGHWRKVKGIGRNPYGVRNEPGQTWVKDHVKGTQK